MTITNFVGITKKAENPEQSNKSNDTANKSKGIEKTTEERKSPSSFLTANSAKNTDTNKPNAESKSVANKSKAVTNKSEFASQNKKKSSAKSPSSSASPKGQYKKGNAKENLRIVEKSTAAKNKTDKTKTSPKATVTKAKSTNEVDVNDVTKKVKEASIANLK